MFNFLKRLFVGCEHEFEACEYLEKSTIIADHLKFISNSLIAIEIKCKNCHKKYTVEFGDVNNWKRLVKKDE